MRQRDAGHTLRFPFRPESNSPSLRHFDTRVPTLPLVLPALAGDEPYHIPTSGKLQDHPANSIKIQILSQSAQKEAPDFSRASSGCFRVYFPAVSAALASAAALAFSAWAFLMALYFSFSSAVAAGRMASLGQTLVQSLQPTHLS